MLNFSEQLNNYMKTHAISTVDLAKETGMDRTAIYRYSRGTRIPSNVAAVKKIADALQMSIKERQELLDAYDKLVWGEENVYNWQYMKELLNSFCSIEREESGFYNYWKVSRELQMDTEILELNSKEEIVTCISNLMCYVAEKENTQKIFLTIQPVYDEIQRYILPIFRDKKINIEQIICMEKSREKSYENLKIFQEILPLCFGMNNYEVFYYYDSLASHFNSMSGMTNLILLQDYVIQFDYQMQRGIVSKNPALYNVMYQQYEVMRQQSQKLMTRVSDIIEVSQCIDMLGHGGSAVFRQLCMGFCISKKMYEEHIYPMPGKAEFIDVMIKSHGDWKEEQYVEGNYPIEHIVSYGTKWGMEEFMKTGRVQEFPAGLYEPFSVEERKIILDRIIRLAEMEKLSFRLFPEEIQLASSVQIYLSDSLCGICLNYIKADGIRQIVIKELSICRTCRNCMEYLERREMMLGAEETLEWLLELKERCV